MNRIALTMLLGDRLKYYGLVIGIAFAAMLMAQQLSIFNGFTTRTGAFIRDTAQADLWVMDPQIRFSQESVPLRDTALQLVRGVSGVAWAVPLYQGFIRGRLPDGTRVTMIVVGLDDATLTGAPPIMRVGRLEDLRRDGAVLIDAVSAEEKLRMRRGGGRALQPGDYLTINDHDALVVGSYEGRRSFFWEPVVYTTYTRALRMSPPQRNLLSFVLVKLQAGADLDAVKREIEVRTGLKARTNHEFDRATTEYILGATGIRINFGLAVALSFLIGLLIAGQTFYNFTLDNLRHYGALKAMGVGDARLAAMVLLQACTVAVLGYGIGVGFACLLGLGLAKAGLAFTMSWQIPVVTLLAIIAICAVAALLSLLRVFRLEPAEVFKA